MPSEDLLTGLNARAILLGGQLSSRGHSASCSRAIVCAAVYAPSQACGGSSEGGFSASCASSSKLLITKSYNPLCSSIMPMWVLSRVDIEKPAPPENLSQCAILAAVSPGGCSRDATMAWIRTPVHNGASPLVQIAGASALPTGTTDEAYCLFTTWMVSLMGSGSGRTLRNGSNISLGQASSILVNTNSSSNEASFAPQSTPQTSSSKPPSGGLLATAYSIVQRPPRCRARP
mmetsp:Transcript_81360/g.220647  ORF Transcript_81360/g.220647 Transcript_81360/m.220647 type:complete len:232 (+) Transcript_81360:138-833(+)